MFADVSKMMNLPMIQATDKFIMINSSCSRTIGGSYRAYAHFETDEFTYDSSDT